MRKPTICICENTGADQLHSNCEADQRLCFRYTDSTIPLLSTSKISSLKHSSVLLQPGLCRTCSETTLLVFPRGGSIVILMEAPSVSSHVLGSKDLNPMAHQLPIVLVNTKKQYICPNMNGNC